MTRTMAAAAPPPGRVHVGLRQPQLPSRFWLAAAAVLVPVGAGLLASVLMWVTQSHELVVTPQVVSTVVLRDNAVLIPWPLTSAPMHLAAGQQVEVILPHRPGQNIVSSDQSVFAAISIPPCHLFPICVLTQLDRFAFQARRPGTAVLLVTEAGDARGAVRDGGLAEGVPGQVPITVYARPQTRAGAMR